MCYFVLLFISLLQLGLSNECTHTHTHTHTKSFLTSAVRGAEDDAEHILH